MSEHNVELGREQTAVDELLRKVDVLRETRPDVHAEIVHPGIAASIVDPHEEPSKASNESLKKDFESA